ncbi:hypothetical protein FRC04_003149 [Tulasnella sp. 424]|nr:hypothetical protein FRC04_003149 [Tulasnella sp. 424]
MISPSAWSNCQYIGSLLLLLFADILQIRWGRPPTLLTGIESHYPSPPQVTKAIAQGDLTKRIEVHMKGEILELKQTVNSMTETLSTFAAEVTHVAHEIGTEGKLGGHASVPGVSGTWKDLADNVNNMTLNKCDGVSVAGEILDLVNTINSMIDQLAVFTTEVVKVA